MDPRISILAGKICAWAEQGIINIRELPSWLATELHGELTPYVDPDVHRCPYDHPLRFYVRCTCWHENNDGTHDCYCLKECECPCHIISKEHWRYCKLCELHAIMENLADDYKELNAIHQENCDAKVYLSLAFNRARDELDRREEIL